MNFFLGFQNDVFPFFFVLPERSPPPTVDRDSVDRDSKYIPTTDEDEEVEYECKNNIWT